MMSDSILFRLAEIIKERRRNPSDGSYTCYLFEQGLDKILKKVGEESTEAIVAAKNYESGGSANELICETSDLFYHLLVLLEYCDVSPGAVFAELEKRSQKTGNKKEIKTVDKNT